MGVEEGCICLGILGRRDHGQDSKQSSLSMGTKDFGGIQTFWYICSALVHFKKSQLIMHR